MTTTVLSLMAKKANGERITMLTAYDATFARLVDEGGADAILVGDSLGMVVKGEPNTLNVSLDEIAYHTKAVARGAKRAHIVGDMPFLSYQVSTHEAVRNAGKLLQAGAHAVKLEGGRAMAETVRAIVAAGIPVMGHVGLLPQSVHAQGGFKVQGKDAAASARILDDARALEEAGAYAVVLEGIPAHLAVEITSALRIPTIGIGAGVGCDGQVLVLYDLLGLDDGFRPKFVKKFAHGARVVRDAVAGFVDEVGRGVFPALEHSFGAKAAAAPAPASPPSERVHYGPSEVLLTQRG